MSQKQIAVGETYSNGQGFLMEVIRQIEGFNGDYYHVINKGGAYNRGDYGIGYVVNKFGRFGNYPNHRDLIIK